MTRRGPGPGLDQVSLECLQHLTMRLRIRRTQANLQARTKLQIAIREAIRDFLPLEDPRRHPNFPHHEETRDE